MAGHSFIDPEIEFAGAGGPAQGRAIAHVGAGAERAGRGAMLAQA